MRQTIICFCIIAIVLLFQSCTDDSTSSNNNNNGPPVTFTEGYDSSESMTCMTLAALSYVSENNPTQIRDSLIYQLSITDYATSGHWILDWGPGLSPDNSNMMYVAKDTASSPNKYCIAIRGTDWCYYMNWKEDFWIIELEKYPYGGSGDSISSGALTGLNYLLSMRDPVSNQTIVSYLNSLKLDTTQMFITGHSLGGQLASVFSAWFLDNGYASNLYTKVYTYAAPSPGNDGFLNHYNSLLLMSGAESYRIVNPLDLVPNFCASVEHVINNQIPTLLPVEVKAVFAGMQEYLNKNGIVYKNVGEEKVLSILYPGNCNYPLGSLDQYACYVAFEHHTDTYLSLLGAQGTYYYTGPCTWK